MKRVILLLFGVISAVFVCGLGDKCSNCLPEAHLRIYEQRSCKPIMSSKCNCALYYDCPPEVVIQPLPEAEVLKLKTLGENACIFDGKKVYKIGENLDIPCSELCFCESSKTARNVSGYMIKGNAYGPCRGDHWIIEPTRRPARGCHRTYTSERCARYPNGQICQGDKKADFRCQVTTMEGEKIYRYGEQFSHIKKQPCTICHCDEKFDEDNLEQSTCWKERCHFKLKKHLRGKNNSIDQDVLMQHCTPVYDESWSGEGCCPWDFICEENFKPDAGIFGDRPTNLTDTCWLRGEEYDVGEKMDFEQENTYSKYRGRKGGECTCRVPPLMTCYYTKYSS